ncbi:MAG: choice-of-anchor D domain-containing protein [Candidatus Solibacter usitatus]|nr:choice-of-anchor D domain-containing protein [Candidatus Solibacter usitatus]
MAYLRFFCGFALALASARGQAYETVGTFDRFEYGIDKTTCANALITSRGQYTRAAGPSLTVPLSESELVCPDLTLSGSFTIALPRDTSSSAFAITVPIRLSTRTWAYSVSAGVSVQAAGGGNCHTGFRGPINGYNVTPDSPISDTLLIAPSCGATFNAGTSTVTTEAATGDRIYENQTRFSVSGVNSRFIAITVYSYYRFRKIVQPAVISLSRTSISLAGAVGGAPQVEMVTLTNSGEADLQWTVDATSSTPGNWISMSATSGTLAGGRSTNLTISFDRRQLPSGQHTATITFRGGTGIQPAIINVTGALTPAGDELTLSDAAPPPLTRFEVGQVVSLAATVRYALTSQDSAEMQLRCVDSSGAVLGASGAFQVAKNEQAQRRINLAFDLKATPSGQIFLLAVFQRPGDGGILKESSRLEYRTVLGPKITLSLTNPKIVQGAIDAGIYQVTMSITYRTGVRQRNLGEVRFSDGLLTNKATSLVVNSEVDRVSTMGPLLYEFVKQDRPFTITAVLTDLATKEEFSDQLSFKVLEGATLSITVEGDDLKPLIAGYRLDELDDKPTVRAKYSGLKSDGSQINIDNSDNDRLGSVFVKDRTGTTNIQLDTFVRVPTESISVKGELFYSGSSDIRARADFQHVSVEWVYVGPPDAAKRVIAGDNVTLDYFVRYQVRKPSTMRLVAYVTYLGLNAILAQPPGIVLKDNLTRSSENTTLTGTVRGPEAVPLATEKVRLRVVLESATGEERFAAFDYVDYQVYHPARIPAGASKTKTKDVTINALKNDVIRDVTNAVINDEISRQANEFLNVLKLAPDSRPAGTSVRNAAIAPSQFIGLNRTWEFTPPIPDNSSFEADLIFDYDPASFPDDPNFREADMKVIALDPATGAMESFPTIVDLTARTATARVRSLARFYSLAVTGPFRQLSLASPVPGQTTIFTNTGRDAADLTAVRFDRNGSAPDGPASSRLEPSQQVSTTAPGAWVRVRTSQPSIQGVALLSDADGIAAASLPSRPSSLVTIAGVELSDSVKPELYIANTSSLESVIDLQLRNASGALRGRISRRIAAKAVLQGALNTVFADTEKPFTGYLVIAGSQPMFATMLVRPGRGLAAINGQPMELSGVERTYFLPVLNASRLVLLNATSRANNVTVRAFSESGDPLGRALTTRVGPGEQLTGTLVDLLSVAEDIAGQVLIESTGPLSGGLYRIDANAAIAEALPLLERARAGVIGAMVNKDAPMSITFLNGGTLPSEVTARVVSSDGGMLGSGKINMPARGAAKVMVNDLAPAAAGQTSGYIAFDATQAVAALGTIAAGELAADEAMIPVIADVSAVSPPVAPAIIVAPSSLDYGEVAVGQTKSLSVTVRNAGTANLIISSVATGDSQFTVSQTTPQTVTPGAQLAIAVVFRPSAPGVRSARLTIASNDPSQPTIIANLNGAGTGTAPPAGTPAITITPAQIAFGSGAIGQTSDQQFAIRNSGTAALTVTSITASASAFTLPGLSVPFTLQPDVTRTVAVRFIAAAPAGAVAGQITVASNDPARANSTIPLTATAAASTGPREVTLQLDDGTFEQVAGYPLGGVDAFFVVRLTPTSYPATLKKVQLFFHSNGDGLMAGDSFSIVHGAYTGGETVSNPLLRQTSARVSRVGAFNEYEVAPITITSGDFLVGITVYNRVGIVPMAMDVTRPQGRSYSSTNGTTFGFARSINDRDGNLGIRAVVDLQ